jgi:hypothetical protein
MRESPEHAPASDIPMKRSLPFVALAAAASFASPIKVGADAKLGTNLTLVGSEVEPEGGTIDPTVGFGVSVGPKASIPIDQRVSVDAGLMFNYDHYGWEYSEERSDATEDIDISLMTLGFRIVPTLKLTEQLDLKLGYEWDMPIGGTFEYEVLIPGLGGDSGEEDVVWAPGDVKELRDYDGDDEDKFPVVPTHNVLVGAGFALNEQLAVTVEGKIALNSNQADYDETGKLKGAEKMKESIMFHRISVGVSYELGL